MVSAVKKSGMTLVAYCIQRPIATIVFISLLATYAYLEIVSLSSINPDLIRPYHIYHRPNQPRPWIPVEDPTKYSDARRYALLRLEFDNSQFEPPRLDDFVFGNTSRTSDVLVPFKDLKPWLEEHTEFPATKIGSDVSQSGDASHYKWLISHVYRDFSYHEWARSFAFKFIALLKGAQTMDIAIMAIVYLMMDITVVGLFLSMRKFGSRFWLAASSLLSSGFAFIFAYLTTLYFQVPISMVRLCEGIPFVVVAIGFDKPLRYTAKALNTPAVYGQSKILQAVSETSKRILSDYAVEIFALFLGYSSGIDSLSQFSFFCMWLLFYDCLLLYTFYTAVLAIKLEINRMKRHVAIQRALEEDGVSPKTAERVADSSDQGKDEAALASAGLGSGFTLMKAGIGRFKILLVLGILVTAYFNFSGPSFLDRSLPVGDAKSLNSIDALASLLPPDVPASVVTILPPLKYGVVPEMTHVESAVFSFLEKWTETVGDPLVSKWIVMALAVSIGLNAFLFGMVGYTSHTTTPLETSRNSESYNNNNAVPNGVEKHTPRRLSSGKRVNDHASSSSDDTSENEDGLVVKAKKPRRSLQECISLLKDGQIRGLSDSEIVLLIENGRVPLYALEKQLGDCTRAVAVRRKVIKMKSPNTPTVADSRLPYMHYDFQRVMGACCENVIGYMPIPVGVAGPMLIDDIPTYIPMATTEGCLVASAMRGCKAINAGGGVVTVLTHDGMTRGPCVSFPSVVRAGAAKIWLDSDEGQRTMKKAFDSTSRFARLGSLKTAIAGSLLFIRFCTTTGDAMGMNMISKGVEHALTVMGETEFPDMTVVSVSGNYCIDKKPAAINWIEGRGKSVVAEAVIPANIVKTVLKSDVDALVELNTNKNFIGSAMAGSIGGFNAHAANMVTAIFLATGQDPAQNVESSNCITVMKNVGGDLQISVSMPSIEVGTIGGGTILEPQAALLDLLGIRGPHATAPGSNARQLARIVAAGVLAGELSLCSALAAGHLVQSHMTHNRSQANTPKPKEVLRLSEGAKTCLKG